MASRAEQQMLELLDAPREDLEVEVKEWLDLTQREVGADLVRELIALANHGGGWLLFGFIDEPSGWRPCAEGPADSGRYSQDAINGLVRRHATPAFHCDVHRLASSLGNEHVVVQVPGNHRVPIRAKRATHGSRLIDGAYYVRRPGPESAPADAPEDWDALLRRCVAAQREELLQSFRSIVHALQGGSGPAHDLLQIIDAAASEAPERAPESQPKDPRPGPSYTPRIRPTDLDRWDAACWTRFQDRLAAERGPDAHERYRYGSWSCAYRLTGTAETPTLASFKRTLDSVRGHETGWPVWLAFEDPDSRPVAVDGAVEAWIWSETFADGAHSDFWRAKPPGFMYLLRGFQEDSEEGHRQSGLEPGSVLDLTIPVWRTAECLLHAARLSEALGAEAVEVAMTWRGLKGRVLSAWAARDRSMWGDRTAQQDSVRTVVATPAHLLTETLPEVARALVAPLCEAFDVFEPPDALHAEEIAKLRRHA